MKVYRIYSIEWKVWRINSVKIMSDEKSLKEHAEGGQPTGLPITDVLESIVGVEGSDKVRIDSAFRVGQYKRNAVRSRDLIVTFSEWTTKKLIMTNFRQQGNLGVECMEVQAFPAMA